MAAKEMYDYLSAATADVDVTLSTPKPQEYLLEEGTKNQDVLLADDGSEQVVTLADAFIFYATLRWDYLSESDAGTILDLYYNTSYANRRAKSIKWAHPTDGHTYVVKFAGDMSRIVRAGAGGIQHGVSEIKLKVLGYVS